MGKLEECKIQLDRHLKIQQDDLTKHHKLIVRAELHVNKNRTGHLDGLLKRMREMDKTLERLTPVCTDARLRQKMQEMKDSQRSTKRDVKAAIKKNKAYRRGKKLDLRCLTTCSYCGKEYVGDKRKACSVCHEVTYCNKDCQQRHWKTVHKYECKPSDPQPAAETETPPEVDRTDPEPAADRPGPQPAAESPPEVPDHQQGATTDSSLPESRY